MSGGPNLLDYAPTTDGPSWRRLTRELLARTRRFPLPLTALALFVVADLAYHRLGKFIPSDSLHELFVMYFMSPTFFAVAIRARRWFSRTTPGGLHIYWCLAKDAIPILLLGIYAWLISERRTFSAFLWMLAGATVATVSVRIVFDFYYFSDPILYDLRFWNDIRNVYRVGWMYDAGIWTVMVVGAISWSQRAAGGRLWVRAGLLSTAVATVAIHAIAFGPMIVPLARHSLRSTFPFGRDSAVRIIEFAGTASDVNCIYDALDQSGWLVGYYDRACFHVACVRDPGGVVDHISHRLLTVPTGELADTSAPMLAAQHRYETVPILLRHAYYDLDQTNFYASSPNISRALEDMGIPHVALVLIDDATTEQVRLHSGAPDLATAKVQERLHRLLGVDAGDNLDSWARICWRLQQ